MKRKVGEWRGKENAKKKQKIGIKQCKVDERRKNEMREEQE